MKTTPVAVNTCVVVHHHEVEQQRIVEEIDFFDDQRPRRLFILPQRKGAVEEIFFPAILKYINISLPKKRALDDDQQSAADDQILMKKRKIHVEDQVSHHKIIRLFGVNIISGINDDHKQENKLIDEQEPKVPLSDNLKKNKKKERCSKKKYNPRNSTVLRIQEPQNPNNNIAPPSLHPWVLQHIQLNGGPEPQLLFEKKLEKSDVDEGLGRLFVTRSEKLLDALTEEERRVVLDEESKRGIRVYTIDPEGKTYELFLKRWPSLRIIVLNHDWRKLCSANKLEKGDRVQGWGYHQNSNFCFALNFIKKDEEEGCEVLDSFVN